MARTFGFMLALLLLAAPVHGITVTPAGQSSNLQVEYDEPTENHNGTPLQDLEDTHVTYDKGAGQVECSRTPASTATGGGHVQTMCSVPANRGEEFDVDIRAYATDHVGNVSDPSETVTKYIDRNPPKGPK